MKLIKIASTILFLVITLTSVGQTGNLLTNVPETKDDFIESEKSTIATINYLESTAVNMEDITYQQQLALFTGWIIKSPTVTVEINEFVLKLVKKNSELMIIFMAGWTKYSLENNYSTDPLQANLAGIRSAIKVYQLGGLKKDRNLKKLIKLEAAGELEAWVQSQIDKK